MMWTQDSPPKITRPDVFRCEKNNVKIMIFQSTYTPPHYLCSFQKEHVNENGQMWSQTYSTLLATADLDEAKKLGEALSEEFNKFARG